MMERDDFASLLDRALTNPLLRGLDVAYVRLLPDGADWWSPDTHRTLEIYLYPGPFGAGRLQYMDARARSVVERAAAELVGAHDGRLLPAPPLPLRLGEWLLEAGYCILLLGSPIFIEGSPERFLSCAVTGAVTALAGRALHTWMWSRVSSPRFAARLRVAVPSA